MKNPFSQDWSYFLAELDKRGFLSLVAKPLKSVCVTCFSWKKKYYCLLVADNCTHLTVSVWDCGC